MQDTKKHSKSMAKAWQEHGGSMARARQEHGKSMARNMARAWPEHGKGMARAQHEHGKSMASKSTTISRQQQGNCKDKSSKRITLRRSGTYTKFT
jgi:hypothetical protein